MLALFASLVLVPTTATLPSPQGEKITPTFVATDHADVQFHSVSPDGLWVVYLADQPANPMDFSSPPQIFSVPADGSADPVRLNQPLTTGGMIGFPDELPFAITPDSSRVVFIADAEEAGRRELFSVPIDGSEPPTQLHPEYADGSAVDFEISPDGASVAYRANHLSGAPFELFVASADGSGSPAYVAPLPTSAWIRSYGFDPTGTRMLYVSGTSGRFDLWSVSANGLGAPVRLNDPLLSQSSTVGGQAYLDGPDFQVTPDGAFVFYAVNMGLDSELGLYRSPIATSGAAVDVSEYAFDRARIRTFLLTPDGDHIVFRVNKDVSNELELFSRPTDLSGPPVQLNGNLAMGGNVHSFEISPDSTRVVYRADQDQDQVFELYSVPVQGGVAQQLNDELPPGGSVSPTFAVTPNSARVVFRADGEQAGHLELYGVAIDASTGMARLSPDLPGNVEEHWALTDNGLGLAFILDSDVGARRLYAGATSAGVPPLRLDPGTAFLPGVGLNPVITPGNRVIYTAEQDAEDSVELFSVPFLGGVQEKLNGPFAKLDFGEVSEFLLTPSGDRVVFLADADRPDSFELFVMPVDGSELPRRLHPPTPTEEHRSKAPTLSPDGRLVAFLGGVDYTDPVEVDEFDLFVTSLDGSTPLVRLSQDLAPGQVLGQPRFTPDSSWVHFGVYDSNDATYDVYTVPADGSAAPLLLVDVLAPGGFVSDRRYTPDGSTLIYRAEQEVNDRYDLYSVPVDASSAPVRLSEFQYPTGGDVRDWFLTPDGASVVYLADQVNLGEIEVHRRPIDAGSPSILLSTHPGSSHRVVDFDLSPDGTLVTYADGGRIYLVGAGGGEVPDLIVDPLESFGSAFRPRFDPTQSHVVFRGDLAVDGRIDLNSVALAGSGPVTRLSPVAAPNGSFVIGTPLFTPEGARVIFGMDGDVRGRYELYSALLDGSAPALRVNPAFSSNASDVGFDFQLTPGGGQVVFMADPIPGTDELFLATVDGSRPARRLNRPLGPGQDVYSFLIARDEDSVVYHGNQSAVELDELFRSTLRPHIRRTADPERHTVLGR